MDETYDTSFNLFKGLTAYRFAAYICPRDPSATNAPQMALSAATTELLKCHKNNMAKAEATELGIYEWARIEKGRTFLGHFELALIDAALSFPHLQDRIIPEIREDFLKAQLCPFEWRRRSALYKEVAGECPTATGRMSDMWAPADLKNRIASFLESNTCLLYMRRHS
jgi:hypothetical protein